MKDRNVLRVTLEYEDINYLFDQPDVSPFSEDFHVYSTVPGVEYLYSELHANPSLKKVEATILLPREQITPTLEHQTRDAIRRYCLARSREMLKDERALRWRGLRALGYALVLFVGYVLVERPLGNSENWILNLIGEGLGIVVWVALWFPLDALVFGLRSHDMDSHSYRQVSNLQLTIRPAT